MNLNIYFDGACRQHRRKRKGVAAWGFVVKDDKGEVIHKDGGRVGKGWAMSVNVAEYEALYQAMLWVSIHHPEAKARFNGDSVLVISQMKGEAQAIGGKYMAYHNKAVALATPFIMDKRWTFNWIQRAFNSEADELAQTSRF